MNFADESDTLKEFATRAKELGARIDQLSALSALCNGDELPIITRREDVGDEDRTIWVVAAEFKGETAEATHGNRFTAERLATDAVRAKVAGHRTPDTDTDFNEVD
jgi:hypothetical protein